MIRYYLAVKNLEQNEVRELLDRIARINAAQDWAGDVNPSQRAALSYLARANRFSRAPSQVADYLSATRGTVSQTLKALTRKGLITEQRSQIDKRSISYEITKEGLATLSVMAANPRRLENLPKRDMTELATGLKKLVMAMLKARGSRSFGVCASCRYHEKRPNGAFCILLKEPLKARETSHICYEHEAKV